MKNLLIITADTNDADYVDSIQEIDNETLEEIIGILNKIKESGKKTNYGIFWGKGEYCDLSFEVEYEDILTEDELEFFDSFVPWGEHGIHTITSVEVYKNIGDKEELLV